MAMSEKQKKVIQLELRKSRFDVSRAVNLLNKTIMLYVIFLVVAVFGSVMNFISQKTVALLVIMGVVLLFVGVIPYFKIMVREEERLSNLINTVKGKR